jgi:GT2 family glycosyltransferase
MVACKRDLVLIFVAFHPSAQEVHALQACLMMLNPSIGYAIAVNDHIPGEPVEDLFSGADCVLCQSDNIGYGRAVNRLVSQLPSDVPFVAALNTDLTWQDGTIECMLSWLQRHPKTVLLVPRIVAPDGMEQRLCKRNPTILALFSRRFLPLWLKPRWLIDYDEWFAMSDADYSMPFSAPYLSGCCMVMRRSAFVAVKGFDERFFLYLEDADLTRRLRAQGDTFHFPLATVVHSWGRGNHRSLRLTVVNVISAWLYFKKWGLRWA